MVDTGQVTSSAAEIYDEFFLPALFAAWPPQLVESAQIGPGMRVVDVACGTGALAVETAKAVGAEGSVVGLDLNPDMLAVAGRKSAQVDWREAPAEALPFDHAEFDAAVSQFGLMFFQDRSAALSEMWRVLRPGGRLAVAVWDSLENTPGYSAVTALLARLFGQDIADLLRAPYCLGGTEQLRQLLADAGIEDPQVSRLHGEARFPSIRSWMHTDVRGWTLTDKLDDDQFERLVSEAEKDLARFVTPDGTVQFAHPALIATARRP